MQTQRNCLKHFCILLDFNTFPSNKEEFNILPLRSRQSYFYQGYRYLSKAHEQYKLGQSFLSNVLMMCLVSEQSVKPCCCFSLLILFSLKLHRLTHLHSAHLTSLKFVRVKSSGFRVEIGAGPEELILSKNDHDFNVSRLSFFKSALHRELSLESAAELCFFLNPSHSITVSLNDK